MTEQELHQEREQRWRTKGQPVRTLEQARSFLDDVGFCVMYPERSLPLTPTFLGAFAGEAQNLPDAKHAFADPRAQQAMELMVRLLRERSAYEMSLLPGADLIVAAALFPYFYALVGDRNPKASPKTRAQGAPVSPLAVKVFDAVQKKGPLSKERLREQVGRELSIAAVDRALLELWSILKITRVDYRPEEGVFWDVLYRWSPKVVKEALQISEPEAISAVLSKYLESVVACSREELESFFGHLTSRSKVREAVNALLAARELSFVTVASRTLIRLGAPEELQRRRKRG
jgi:hypothetical protein